MNQKPSNFHFKTIEGKVHLPSKTNAKKNISPKMKKTNAPKRNEKPILISNEKDLEKVRKSYFDFVKKNIKYFKIDSNNNNNIQNKKDENIAEKIPEIKADIISNIIVNIKETNASFNDFLDTVKPVFLEENIICELPDIPELYIAKKQIGIKTNNKNDYSRRKVELIKDNEKEINENLELDKEITEPNIEIQNDKNLDYNPIKIRNAELIMTNLPTPDDQTEIENQLIAMNNIVDICLPKLRKEILFRGYNPDNNKDILIIFGKRFNKEGKFKIIEYHSFNARFGLNIDFEKTVKELFNLDYISIEEISPRINEVIKKFKAEVNN